MQVKLYKVGYCLHPGFIAGCGLGLRPRRFPSSAALILHPERGRILFDTGYHKRFISATTQFPERFYGMTTPCTLMNGESLREQLNNEGCSSIDYVVLSHFHADHIAGLCDFPEAQIICSKEEFSQFISSRGLRSVLKGYLRELMPKQAEERVQFTQAFTLDVAELLGARGAGGDERSLLCYDMFGDESIYLVSLPGHTVGQIGMIVRLDTQFIFFLADGCWLMDNIILQTDPHWLTNIICHDVSARRATMEKLRTLHREVGDRVIFAPSHCLDTVDMLVRKSWIS